MDLVSYFITKEIGMVELKKDFIYYGGKLMLLTKTNMNKEMMSKELTKTKLHKILKEYRFKLEQHNKEWEEVCRKKCKHEEVGEYIKITTPSIYDHERHAIKGDKLFKDLMKEFDGYEVFNKLR